MSAPKAILRQLRRSPSPPPSLDSFEVNSEYEHIVGVERRDSGQLHSMQEERKQEKDRKNSRSWKEPQPYEVSRAIERKDIMYIMEIRDRAFHLLLRKTGDATPLVHAMRIGESHRDIAILLVGAMSRWVNHLEAADLADKKTKVLLKALRTNLKLAIDYGLQHSQSDLTASFMQTLVMSEGDKWVLSQVALVALALRAGTQGRPVFTAGKAIRSFATKELGKADAIATLEEYIANATADLLLLASWSLAMESISGEPIPTYFFARDDRVYKAFSERIQQHRAQISQRLSKRLKWQIRVMEKGLEGRTTAYHSKIGYLTGELDEGDGV